MQDPSPLKHRRRNNDAGSSRRFSDFTSNFAVKDPSEDTEWNAILREKGILPPLPKPTEESPGPSPETKRREAAERLSYDKLTARIESLEDTGQDEDETKFLEEYRQKRMAEMRQAAARAKFGSVREVTKTDWVNEINQAGKAMDDEAMDSFGSIVWLNVVHANEGAIFLVSSNEKCSVVDMHLRTLAARYPDVKFVRGEVTSCIPDLPDSNLPTLIVYYEGEVRVRLVGSKALGGHPVSIEALEDRLANASVIKPPEKTEKSSKKPTLIRGRLDVVERSGQWRANHGQRFGTIWPTTCFTLIGRFSCWNPLA
ncbi:unnamed protein product [Schistocephalus solidus]|uniref:Phosducin domain-containing protein n=1 Tax=Schistocephalus solidus TaxID=70667 RepID=A0A183SUH9_SCHSO|nr:unnamed protein product [Schistocephalus solidus]